MVSMAGRPTKLTPEVRIKILQLIRGRVPWMAAVKSAGLDYSTFCKWRQRGKDAGRGAYFEFVGDLKKAEAEGVIRNLTIIQKSAMGGEVLERTTVTRPDGSVVTTEKIAAPQWTAAAWWLARRYPEEWGRKDRTGPPPANGGGSITGVGKSRNIAPHRPRPIANRCQRGRRRIIIGFAALIKTAVFACTHC
jgi:hypothetical protein